MIHVDTPHSDTHTYRADSYSIDGNGTLHVLNHDKDVASHSRGSWARVHLPGNEKPKANENTAVHDDGGTPPGPLTTHIRTGTADYYITDDVVKMIERIGDKVWGHTSDGRTNIDGMGQQTQPHQHHRTQTPKTMGNTQPRPHMQPPRMP